MSKAVAKIEKEVTFRDIEKINPNLDFSGSYNLDASQPLPLDFGGKWSDAEKTIHDAVERNDFDACRDFAMANGKTERQYKTARFLTSTKTFTTWVASWGAVFAAGAITVPIAASLEAASMGLVATSFIGVSGLSLILSMTAYPFIEDGLRGVYPKLSQLFESEYQVRVSRWAMERYGVNMLDSRWASDVTRLADDIVYVADHDGEKVYCFETPNGWVLGSRDGTELPVLAKELVEA